jgi:hypothetical protein
MEVANNSSPCTCTAFAFPFFFLNYRRDSSRVSPEGQQQFNNLYLYHTFID